VRVEALLPAVDAAGHPVVFNPRVYKAVEDSDTVVLIAGDGKVPALRLRAGTFNRWLAWREAVYLSW
jgi:hypothetical protein